MIIIKQAFSTDRDSEVKTSKSSRCFWKESYCTFISMNNLQVMRCLYACDYILSFDASKKPPKWLFWKLKCSFYTMTSMPSSTRSLLTSPMLSQYWTGTSLFRLEDTPRGCTSLGAHKAYSSVLKWAGILALTSATDPSRIVCHHISGGYIQ